MNTRDAKYFEPSYFQRLRAMAQGLRKPCGSREYKEACIELQRLSAPLTAIVLPLMMVSLLMMLGTSTHPPERIIETFYEELKPVPPIVETPPPPPETRNRFDENNLNIPPEILSVEVSQAAEISTAKQQTYLTMNALPNNSPLVIEGLYFNSLRNAGDRNGAIQGGSVWGDPQTEAAVMRTLRWLKKTQAEDGSWQKNRIAMTGLAILTFLAHCETPGSSEEFGPTVQKAIEFLLAQQKPDGRFMGVDSHDYSHPIATYALCEAYGMTRHPNVRAAVEKALVPIINGQHPTGGWTYQMNPERESGIYRDDTSYMGWCVQALKAAQLSGLDVPGLDKACKLAVHGFKNNAAPGGGFGYTSPGTGGLTSVGTLSMQLLGASDLRETKLAADLMAQWKPSFAERANGIGDSLQYYYYYATQSKFHFGGPRWEKWNQEMKAIYVAAQKIERDAIQDHTGQYRDIGWWENNDTHTDRPVMDTCLAALQLMVYYRGGLRTTSADAVAVDRDLLPLEDDADIKIYIVGDADTPSNPRQQKGNG